MANVFLALCLLLICLFNFSTALDNGLVRTPPMGWLAWERYRCVTNCTKYPDSCISEKLFLDMADRLVDDGWKDVGYNMVNIDDCWPLKKRDENGNLVADPERFPNGIKYIADYVHKKGLKLGIYGDSGTLTCGGYPGSNGYEKQDAEMFAKWNIDMLKFDGCYSNSSERAIQYPLMGKMLNATGRPIIYECSWPAYEGGLPPKVNYTLLGEICNIWRNYGDIQDSWDDVVDIIGWWGKNQDALVPAAGPGRWNDPDMLIGGDFALSEEQTKTQFGMWAILAAPLFMSNNLRNIDPKIKEILQNRWVIKVNQDKLGIQGRLYKSENKIQLWGRPLQNNAFAIAVISTRTDGFPYTYSFTLTDLKFKNSMQSYTLLNVYKPPSQSRAGTYKINDVITVDINPNGIQMFYVSPQSFAFDMYDEIVKQQNL